MQSPHPGLKWLCFTASAICVLMAGAEFSDVKASEAAALAAKAPPPPPPQPVASPSPPTNKRRVQATVAAPIVETAQSSEVSETAPVTVEQTMRSDKYPLVFELLGCYGERASTSCKMLITYEGDLTAEVRAEKLIGSSPTIAMLDIGFGVEPISLPVTRIGAKSRERFEVEFPTIESSTTSFRGLQFALKFKEIFSGGGDVTNQVVVNFKRTPIHR